MAREFCYYRSHRYILDAHQFQLITTLTLDVSIRLDVKLIVGHIGLAFQFNTGFSVRTAHTYDFGLRIILLTLADGVLHREAIVRIIGQNRCLVVNHTRPFFCTSCFLVKAVDFQRETLLIGITIVAVQFSSLFEFIERVGPLLFRLQSLGFTIHFLKSRLILCFLALKNLHRLFVLRRSDN